MTRLDELFRGILLPFSAVVMIFTYRLLTTPEALSVSAAWALLVLGPGIVVSRVLPLFRCRKGLDYGILDRWTEATAVGLLCLSIWLGISDLLSLSLKVAVIVYACVFVALWIYPSSSIKWKSDRFGWEFVLVVMILAACVIRVLKSPFVPSTDSDLLAHLDGIRQVKMTGEIFPHVRLTDGMAGLKPDPRFGTWHGMVAGIWYLAGSSLRNAWIFSAAWMVGPMLLAMERLARELFQRTTAGVLCLALYVLLMPAVEADLLSMVGLPSVVARCIFGVLLIWCLRGLDGVVGAKWYWGLALAGAGLAIFRLDYFMMLGAVLGVLGCAGLLGFLGEGRWLWVGRLGIWISGAFPLLLYKYSISLPTPPGYLSQFRAGVLLLGRDWWMTDIFRVGVVVVALWTLGMAWFWRSRRRMNRSSWALIAALLVAGLQAFNPLFCRVLEPIVSAPYIVRLARLVPVYVLVTGALLGLEDLRFGKLESKGPLLRSLLTLALVVVAALPTFRDWFPRTSTREYSILGSEMLDWVRDHADDKTTILARPDVSYCIAGLTDLRVVAVPPSHASPWVIDSKERERDTQRALSDCTSLEERLSVVHRYDASWVLYRAAEGVASQWGDARVLHRDGKWTLLDVSKATNQVSGNNRQCGYSKVPHGKYMRSVDAADHLQGYVDWPDTVVTTRGAEIELPITWRSTAPIMEKKIWILRFDRAYPHGPMYASIWSKPYRKLLEVLSRGRYRFRAEGRPCNDRPPIYIWKSNRSYVDTLRVRIPSDVHSGFYQIQLKVRKDRFMQNYRPRDYFSDRDIWSGHSCETVLAVQEH